MSQIVIYLPNTVFSTLRKEPLDFVNEMRIAAAVKWYELGEISQEKAAEVAGLSRKDFLTSLLKYKIDFMQYSEKELESKI